MFRRKTSHIFRTILLRGSPANKVAQWSLAIFMTLIWIYKSEKENPKRIGLFFRDNKAEIMTPSEINEWNARHRPIVKDKIV